MELSSVRGNIHSIQTLGTLDGPGVRFVAFLQGCPLRCGCCHNPDTWATEGGESLCAGELCARALRYRTYFGKEGGVTLSGGEPLLQPAFAYAFFALAREAGLDTCLDTSGALWSEEIERLLTVTDRVLLDIKYSNDEDYQKYVGCSLRAPLRFLSELDARGIPTVLRQVIIPTRNDTEQSVDFLQALRERHRCVRAVELLPFKKICTVKYEQMGIPFRFADCPTPDATTMTRLNERLRSNKEKERV